MRRWRALLAALGAALVLAGLAGAWRLPALAKLDLEASEDLQNLRTPSLDALMMLATGMGSAVFLVPVAILTAFVLAMRRRPREAVACGLGLLAMPLNVLLKLVAHRPRPGEPITVIIQTYGTSFPSGHTMSATAVYGTLAALTWTLRGPRWLVALLLIVPFFVGVSRVYLGAHWGYDVVAGWSAGALCVTGIMAWLRKPAD